MTDLENKVEQEKVDWKELVPLWGVYQVLINQKNGKPALVKCGPPYTFKETIFIIYQALSTAVGIGYGLQYLSDKF